MRRHASQLMATAALSLAAAAVSAQNYVPDTPYRATTMAGVRVIGEAAWRAEKGEYIGSPKSAAGGWLVLDRSLQDVGVFAQFRCTGGCRTGILLRAESTANGMKGVYVSLIGDEPGVYAVTLDGNGRELTRERLRAAGGQLRFAPPPPPAAGGARAGGAGRAAGPGRGGPPPNLPLTPPVTGIKADDWNLVEIMLDATLIRPFLNESLNPIGSAAVDDAVGKFGPVALYVGGTGEVRYRNVGTSDLSLKTMPVERTSPNYRMQRLNDMYYSWGAAVADFNGDGVNDVAAGPYYFIGPDFTKSREIYLAQTINASTQYPGDCMQNFAYDFTGDGAADVICMGAIGQDLHLYVNPKTELRRWDKFDVVPVVQKEVSLLKDVDGDGKPEFVYGGGGFLRFAKPNPSNPTGPWTVHTLSTEGPWGGGHGLGVGDVNGDKRADVVDPYGWWEQPAGGASSGVWTYHPAGVRPVDRPRLTRRRRDWRLRHQRRRPDRRRHVTAGARFWPRMVRAEARRLRAEHVGASHDHRQLHHEERRRRRVLPAARLDRRRRGR